MASRKSAFRIGLGMAILVLILMAGATAVIAWLFWTSGWNQADRIAAVAATFAAGTLALALVAAVVAVLAYWVAIEQPDLFALVNFQGSETNTPVLVIDPERKVGGEVPAWALASFAQVNCKIRLDNRSPYSARNPVVRVELVNMWNLAWSGYWLPVSPITPGARQGGSLVRCAARLGHIGTRKRHRRGGQPEL